ncbi:sulfite exporter TauE/SafE family protein [Pseudooceanicola sp. LIPI14-2-Ac024]|uniref:sulfite exporter TauE/SafE family protein n=1 Tax=Pseudooceanicola sp. LIPI14-2-Ac024 TaxID=3344875 RepID=UPI0035D0607C
MPIPDPLALIAAFIVGMSKGGLVTFGTVAVPLLALRMDPLEAAALLLPVFIVSDMVGVWLYRRDYDARNLRILIPAGLAGVVIATALAPWLPAEVFLIATGLIGLAYCTRAWFGRARNGPPRSADVPRGVFWGILTGVTSFISHSGAPPFQTYVLPQKLPKLVFAGTTTICFAAINLSKLPAYWAIGLFDHLDLPTVGMLVLSAVIGTYAGYRLTRIIPETLYVRLIQIALFLLSIRLIWDGIVKLT